jgi:hypothetical protein
VTAKSSQRQRKLDQHRTLRLSKGKYKQPAELPSLIQLVKSAITLFWSHKKLFLGISAIHFVISFVFIQGLGSSFDLVTMKESINDLLGESGDDLTTAVALFGYLIGSAGTSANESSGAYQIMLTAIVSLAAIWGVRQVQAGETPRIRDTFYKGMYPFIPFMLVVFIMGLQLIPFLLGNLVYTTVIQNSLALTIIEKALWLILFILLALLSLYMIISSIFSLYIVTLPDMTPIKALRSARDLVLHRRIKAGIRLLTLPLLLGILSVVIFIPLLLLFAPAAQILFLLMSSVGLVFGHIYIYLLYRALI